MYASDLYGGNPAPQPVSNSAPAAPGQSIARTTARTGGATLQNPTVLLLILLGVAIALIHFSVGFNFGFKVDRK